MVRLSPGLAWLLGSYLIAVTGCSSDAGNRDPRAVDAGGADGSAFVPSSSPSAGAPTFASAGTATSGTGTEAASSANGGGPAQPADWFDLSFCRRRALLVDAKLSSDESFRHFPAALVLPAGTLPSGSVRDDGADLRFVDADGNLLASELEGWKPGGDAVVWVELPEVPSTVAIYLYYDAPSAEPKPTPPMWQAPYAAVWHFAGDASDSASQHLDGNVAGAGFTAGKLGQAAQFQASALQHISLPRGTALLSGAEAVTESAWVKTQSIDPNGYGVVLGVGTGATSGHLSRTSLMIWGSNAAYPYGGQPLHDALYGEINPDDADGKWSFAASSGAAVAAASWRYVTAVYDVKGKGVSLYLDGQLVAGPLVNPGKGDATPNAGSWVASSFAAAASDRIEIGTEEDASHGFFDGQIDELRIERTARSSAWVAAQALASSGSALSLGPEQKL